MRITYLANARIPTERAHGVQIMKMCQAFKRAGVEIELVVAKRVNLDYEKVDTFDYYKIPEKFSIRRLWLFDLTNRQISLKGFSVVIQNTTFALSAFFYFLFKRTEIIYSRDEFSLFLLSFFKKNLVLELHTFPRSKFFLYKWLFKRVKRIIVINNKLKELIIGLGVESDKILVAHDGVDLEQFDIKVTKIEARKKLNLPLDKKIVIYAGLFDKWKGYLTLLQSSRFFDDEEIKLIMIGGTEKQVDKLKKEYPQVIFLGYLPYTDLPINQKAADVLVIPNSGQMAISKYYTSPLKLFSYMASQRSIVASDLPSLREVLNKNNAVLVEPDNPQALAQGIKDTLKKSDFSVKIAKEAYQDVQKYTWQKRVENIIKFINNV